MSALVFDIEANGFKPDKIWCVVTHDIRSGETRKFSPSQLDEAVEYLRSADKLIGHNIQGYDIPVVNKIFNTKIDNNTKIVDTLVLSRLFNPQREGGHGLEGWGYRLRHPKIEFDEFDSYSPKMLEYCAGDVTLNAKVYRQLCREAKGFSKQSIQLEHDVHKIIEAQRNHGFMLDVKYATMFVASLNEQLAECVERVHETFRPKKIVTVIEPTHTTTGKLSKMGYIPETGKRTRWTDEEWQLVMQGQSPIERIEYEEFNLGSRKQIGEYLIQFGWRPTKFTPTGQPVVDEKILINIKAIPEAQMIAEYLMLQKRIGLVQSWIDAVEEDDRVRGYINTNGAVTGRMTHSKPNLAQVPSVNSPYGHESRRCWTVPKGYKLVGIDASGLELRMLAHRMNDEEFTREVTDGDVHTANQKAARLESRDKAKTFIYALIYGAGDEKLGSITGGGRKAGRQLRENFLASMPAFGYLKDRVERAASKGWVKGLDGRKIAIRSLHSALNAVLQSDGAIVMKAALVILDRYIREGGYDAHFVANIHDEWQIEVREDQAETIGKLGVKAIIEAGELLNVRCRLDGEYKIGNTWEETH